MASNEELEGDYQQIMQCIEKDFKFILELSSSGEKLHFNIWLSLYCVEIKDSQVILKTLSDPTYKKQAMEKRQKSCEVEYKHSLVYYGNPWSYH